jgi:hypothetical protein
MGRRVHTTAEPTQTHSSRQAGCERDRGTWLLPTDSTAAAVLHSPTEKYGGRIYEQTRLRKADSGRKKLTTMEGHTVRAKQGCSVVA